MKFVDVMCINGLYMFCMPPFLGILSIDFTCGLNIHGSRLNMTVRAVVDTAVVLIASGDIKCIQSLPV